ncbi:MULTISPECIES: D-alanine--D-alanine ligase [unclassified Burkholderia]|uniref:D-alanine--D-alanine ligase family protein n=1 Tax=unclassified Burkholderia TaxID=2613784 RepID=UPI00075ACFDC|nr:MULTISPECIES: D-alanine--D-alanine ligase [unclassified Burkholderia]KUY50852.1 D-alanine--D-alanine ligase [Burkholderia sp. RF2-non_BP3]KUY71867.1 D-alanine--D-alanine ligase [Burkholderia sp. RF4-BP95]KUY95607.1 D-alanine--D-alanine ligase [Burkholderia sp. RF7-non_BP1]KUY98946.1 D-alanine--D-alanine ligase [Burkholderia sp. RF7-non_BP4]
MPINNKISIIFGGKSPEHKASLESFRHVRDVIQSSPSLDIDCIYYVNRDNKVVIAPYRAEETVEDYAWKTGAVPYWRALEQMAARKTYVLNLLHGNYGEDGHIQGAASMMSIPGSFGPVLPASLSMSKAHMSQYVAKVHPLAKMPRTLILSEEDQTPASNQIEETFHGCNIVLKPNSLGASLFTNRYQVDNYSISEIQDNLDTIFEFDRHALAQDYIAGDEYSVGCIQFNGVVTALPVVKIKTAGNFFGHEQKHRLGKAKKTVITDDVEITRTMKQLSRDIFESVGFKNMCRFDFIVTPHGDIVFLEANPIPGLMRNSIFPKMLEAANISLDDVILQFRENYFSEPGKKSYANYYIE